MKVTIHQPEHLPWLGLLAKVQASELWIVLDSVPYRKNYFQNRNRIRTTQDDTSWLTVPVAARFGTLIKDVRIGEVPSWQRKYLARVQSLLSRGGDETMATELATILESFAPGDSLRDLNMATANWLMKQFGVETRHVFASAMTASGSKSELILNLCIEAGASTYIAGPSGRDYLQLKYFDDAGIEVAFFDFHHPQYDQGFQDFLPGMSAAESVILKAADRALIADYDLSWK